LSFEIFKFLPPGGAGYICLLFCSVSIFIKITNEILYIISITFNNLFETRNFEEKTNSVQFKEYFAMFDEIFLQMLVCKMYQNQ